MLKVKELADHQKQWKHGEEQWKHQKKQRKHELELEKRRGSTEDKWGKAPRYPFCKEPRHQIVALFGERQIMMGWNNSVRSVPMSLNCS